MSWSRVLGSATLMAFVLSLTVGSAESAIPNPTNKKFYACMNKRTRIIKMLNYPKVKTCPKRHKLIKWNAKGNPGAAGPAGPAGPADWNAIPNKPAGFADGVDDTGYGSAILATGTLPASACNAIPFSMLNQARSIDYRFTIVPLATTPGNPLRFDFNEVSVSSNPDGTLNYYLHVCNNGAAAADFRIRATAFSQGIAPAALKKRIKTAEVRIGKAKKGKKKRR